MSVHVITGEGGNDNNMPIHVFVQHCVKQWEGFDTVDIDNVKKLD